MLDIQRWSKELVQDCVISHSGCLWPRCRGEFMQPRAHLFVHPCRSTVSWLLTQQSAACTSHWPRLYPGVRLHVDLEGGRVWQRPQLLRRHHVAHELRRRGELGPARQIQTIEPVTRFCCWIHSLKVDYDSLVLGLVNFVIIILLWLTTNAGKLGANHTQ